MRVCLPAIVIAVYVVLAGCDNSAPGGAAAPSAAPEVGHSPPAAAPAPLTAPEIIVDRGNVAVGKNRVPAGPGLADKAAVFLRDAPAIEGRAVDIVAMRDASPTDVAAMVDLIRTLKGSAVNVKTEARDSTTQALPLTLSTRVPDCATVAWITKDASIDVWPLGGGTVKRTLRGLAGPDLTLGMEAMHKETSQCEASAFAVGADDTMTWGLVFDLAMTALHQPWTRTSAAILVTGATPGHKVALP